MGGELNSFKAMHLIYFIFCFEENSINKLINIVLWRKIKENSLNSMKSYKEFVSKIQLWSLSFLEELTEYFWNAT